MRPVIAIAALLVGCGTTVGAYVEVPLEGGGTGETSFEVSGWSVALDRAEVAIGPLWLCATEAADPEFCDAAVLETRDTVVVDGLAPGPAPLTTMIGITSGARSAMFDYGVSWIPTEPRPSANEGAPGGRSARFSGRATRGPDEFAFVAELEIAPAIQGGIAVRGLRIAEHEVSAGDVLVVRVDPAAWWSRVDFDRLAARGEDPVVLAPGDPDYEALVVAMTAGVLPSFEWRR